MKKQYIQPELSTIELNRFNIIATSDPNLNPNSSDDSKWNLSNKRNSLDEMLDDDGSNY